MRGVSFPVLTIYAEDVRICERVIAQGNYCSFLNGDFLEIQPEVGKFVPSQSVYQQLVDLNDFDVVEFYSAEKCHVYYKARSNDNTIFVTNKCNSNCIMCPCSESFRKRPAIEDIDHLCSVVEHIPSDASHLTITGGEPTLTGREFFKLADLIRSHFDNTEFTILTNGRTFSDNKYLKELLAHLPSHIQFAIPLHAGNLQIHDMITQAPGSFIQTTVGLENLIANNQDIEIRVVVSLLNAHAMEELASYICAKFKGARKVHFIATEMCGAAAMNRKKVWLDYSEAFKAIENPIVKLINNGFDVRLYNFPLCKVDRKYWMLCARSITDYKIKYLQGCDVCSVKRACGGVFNSTLNLTKMKLEPIEGEN